MRDATRYRALLASRAYPGHDETTTWTAGGERCSACGRQSRIGFSVPNETWVAATHGTWGLGGLLCVVCFADMADERLIPWDAEIEFHPVSLSTSIHLEAEERLGEKLDCGWRQGACDLADHLRIAQER